MARHVLVDPLHGLGALRHGRDDDRDGPARATERSDAHRRGGGRRGSPSRARAVRRASLKPAAALLASLLLAAFSPAEKPAPLSKLDPAPALEQFLAQVARETVAEFEGAGLTEEGISIAVIDLTNAMPSSSFPAAAFRGDVSYYPCSVVKLCFLSYYAAQREDGKLAESPELSRAVTDMITVSSNDATGFVVDSITGTTSGPEIADAREWDRWKAKRNAVNDWFHARGYTNLNANQKTFCEDAYGREQAFRDGGKNRNRMTASEAARILKEIVRNEVAGPMNTDAMLRLLSRDITQDKPFEDMEPEDARLAGQGLPKGSRLWAKSGDAYDFHHLVGRVALPNGSDFVIAVFTKGVKTVPGVIPRVYEKVAEHFMARKP
jgi:beta-lactamase class A